MAHLQEEEIAQYVAGMLSDNLALHNLKSHLASCNTCSETLLEQARLELDVRSIASEAKFCISCEMLAHEDRCQECGTAIDVPGFEIEDILVKNARGRMYMARDQAGTRVALKELAFVQSPSADDVAAFERESSILRTLEHPGIPKFVAAFQVGSGVQTRFYLAQEFVDGNSLEAHMRNHHFSESEVIGIGKEVLSILCYLQSLSPMVFHRDVKPSNIIYGEDGNVMLVDFGSARSMGATSSATLVGTFGYMPVEQLGGIVSASSDVYALGATMCQLLTRRDPWHLLEDRQLLARMNVSKSLREVISTMLAPLPEQRYSGAIEALHALEDDSSDPPPRASLGFVASIISSFVEHRAIALALVAVLAVLAVSAGAAGYGLFAAGDQRANDTQTSDTQGIDRGKPGTAVTVGEATIVNLPDRLSTAQVKEGMNNARGAITNCLVDSSSEELGEHAGATTDKEATSNEFEGSENASNTVRLNFRIGPNGQVSGAKADRGSARLRECLEAAITEAKFAKSIKGSVVTYPFMLKSQPIACNPTDPLCGL